MAKENAKPTRILAGQKTLLSRTMHDIRYDALHDEIFVTNPFAQAVLVFRGGADGEEAPLRVIQGPRTQLAGSAYAGVDRLDVDPVHNEIFVPARNVILVFPRDATGDVAPIRVIKGPETRIQSSQTLAVDPVRNLIVAGDTGGGDPERNRLGIITVARGDSALRRDARGSLLIFNRTDQGNVKPLRVIHGPKAGIASLTQLQVYSPRGWIVMTGSGIVGIWSVFDDGDVPPRWKLDGPKSTLIRPRGVTLNPRDKELIVVDMRLNSVLTYSFPEIF